MIPPERKTALASWARGWSLRTLTMLALVGCWSSQAQQIVTPTEGEFVIRNFQFKSKDALPELRLHYLTLGSPARDSAGNVTNAVLILHSTASTSQQFLVPNFAGELFGPGQVLDARRYFIILPDAIGHGKSSKPSDGLRARFPRYDYDDMVMAQHALVKEGLGIGHLRLVLGTSMGCMHSWVWAEAFPGFMDTVMPLACLPAPVAGRNRMWRDIVMQAIRQDPDWKDGDYADNPQRALLTAAGIMLVAGSGAFDLQRQFPDRDSADRYLDEYTRRRAASLDANDLLYALNASWNYDPSGKLGSIAARVTHVNFADDFINPPELGIAEAAIRQVKRGRFVLAPVMPETRGHLTHTSAAIWRGHLQELLMTTAPP